MVIAFFSDWKPCLNIVFTLEYYYLAFILFFFFMEKHLLIISEIHWNSILTIFLREESSSILELHTTVPVSFNIKYYDPKQCYGEFQ